MSRPPLRLIDGLRERAEEAEAEAVAVRFEAEAHVRRMRMAMQTRFWTDPEFAEFARAFRQEVDEFERRVMAAPGHAA